MAGKEAVVQADTRLSEVESGGRAGLVAITSPGDADHGEAARGADSLCNLQSVHSPKDLALAGFSSSG